MEPTLTLTSTSTPALPVTAAMAEFIADSIDWMESNGLDKEQVKLYHQIQDWIKDNYPDIAMDHWYYPKGL